MSSFGSDSGGKHEARVRLEWPGVRPFSRSWSPGVEAGTDEGAALAETAPESDPEVADGPMLAEEPGADVEELRFEVASLRQSLHELTDRVELRDLGTVLDELAELRAEVRELVELRASSPKLGTLAPLVAEIAALREEVSLEPVLAELRELRSELSQVRRRMRLRAGGGNANEFPT